MSETSSSYRFELNLLKLVESYRLVLRIRCDAQFSQCPLGEKYGCNPDTEAPGLIELSKSLGLNVRNSLTSFFSFDNLESSTIDGNFRLLN